MELSDSETSKSNVKKIPQEVKEEKSGAVVELSSEEGSVQFRVRGEEGEGEPSQQRSRFREEEEEEMELLTSLFSLSQLSFEPAGDGDGDGVWALESLDLSHAVKAGLLAAGVWWALALLLCEKVKGEKGIVVYCTVWVGGALSSLQYMVRPHCIN